ncbi:MAG: Hpt domain-containing protein [Chloroflexota bacterium]|nr:MAG: Hpt domain-containing protein [Chloroflexota bacterium]
MEYEGVIDREVLDNLLEAVGGDGEFLSELLETYFSDSPQLFSTMHMALSAGNAEEFRRAAHSLKSNSANFGALNLSRQAKELEEMGKTGELDKATGSLAEAEREYDKVKSALEFIQKHG